MIQSAKCLLAVRGIVHASGLIAVKQVPFSPRGDVDLKPVLADDRSVALGRRAFPGSGIQVSNFQCGLPATMSMVFSRLVTGIILRFVCPHSVLFGRITRISERIDPLA